MPEKESSPASGKNGSKKESISLESVYLVDNQNYLMPGQCVPFFKEWKSLYHAEDMVLDLAPEHAFGIVLKLSYAKFMDPEDELSTARLFLGIKNQQKEYKECIELGLYMGRLYIKDLFDVVSIDKEKLVEGIHIVLAVTPKVNRKSEAVLMALDLSGAVLAKLKTSKILMSDWNGGISPAAHFKSMRIESLTSDF